MSVKRLGNCTIFRRRILASLVKRIFSLPDPSIKWTETEDPLQKGDIVLIADSQTLRNLWKNGEIIRICKNSDDDQVRIAEIRTFTGVFTRPIRKLVKLLGVNEVQN